jgi:hypothetical protein
VVFLLNDSILLMREMDWIDRLSHQISGPSYGGPTVDLPSLTAFVDLHPSIPLVEIIDIPAGHFRE